MLGRLRIDHLASKALLDFFIRVLQLAQTFCESLCILDSIETILLVAIVERHDQEATYLLGGPDVIVVDSIRDNTELLRHLPGAVTDVAVDVGE
jgi:hypothetical protein